MRKGKKVVSGQGTPERDGWPVGCKELQNVRYYLGLKSKVSMRSESRKPNGEPGHENSLRWTKEHGLTRWKQEATITVLEKWPWCNEVESLNRTQMEAGRSAKKLPWRLLKWHVPEPGKCLGC